VAKWGRIKIKGETERERGVYLPWRNLTRVLAPFETGKGFVGPRKTP